MLLILDPKNYYNCDKIIDRNNETINSICELEDGTIVSCDNNNIQIVMIS